MSSTEIPTLEIAVSLYSSGKFAEAATMAQHLLATQPGNVDAMNLAAVCSRFMGRLEDAEVYWTRATQANPRYADAHNNLGNLFFESKRHAEAETSFRRALSVRPDYAEAHNNLGNLLLEQKRHAEAEASFRRALSIRLDYAEAHNNLGNLLLESKRHAEAETSFRQALAFRPNHANAFYNLGSLLLELSRFNEAEACFQSALSIRPDYVDAYNNLGVLYQSLKLMAEAEACYKRALAIRPDYPDARSNLGLLHLFQGRYRDGWPLYEARYDSNRKQVAIIPPSLPYPKWSGEDLRGKSILVWPEQGYGDEIQFVRYLPLLKVRGASRITLVCKPALKPLFLHALAGADRVVSETEAAQLEHHDFWTLLLSLPMRFNTTAASIPAAVPYLAADVQRVARWAEKLPAMGCRIGLVWKGSSEHKNDAHRSLPGLASLAPLWSVAGLTFISLQKGSGEEEASAPPAGMPLLQLGADIVDFADTAAIVSQLDLVICVDTAIAHLAGALGKPCWILLPCIGTDWRWMDERRDTPWYPGVIRLFRQARPNDWTETIAEVASELADFTSRGFPVGTRAD